MVRGDQLWLSEVRYIVDRNHGLNHMEAERRDRADVDVQ